MLQRTVLSIKQYATTNDATMNECYNEQFINKIRILQQKHTLQRPGFIIQKGEQTPAN